MVLSNDFCDFFGKFEIFFISWYNSSSFHTKEEFYMSDHFIDMVNNHHAQTTEDKHNAFLKKYQVSNNSKKEARRFKGSIMQRDKAVQKTKTSSFKKTLAALGASGILVLGSLAISENSMFRHRDTYLPEQATVMEQIESAMLQPKNSQLDDIFTYTQRNDLEEMKKFENNIITYSNLKEAKNLTSEQKKELQACTAEIQDYYNQNTSMVNSTMLSLVKVAIADTYTNTHELTLADGTKVPDTMSARDITFLNVSDANYQAAKIGSTPLNFKEAPEIYDAVHAIVLLQAGNTKVQNIVDAYAKSAKVLDTNLSIEKNNSKYIVSSQRDLIHEEDWTR